MAEEPSAKGLVVRSLIKALRLHHQKGRSEVRDAYVPERFGPLQWRAYQRQLYNDMKTLFAPDFTAVQSCRHLDAACVTVWGLVVLSDWLASGQEAFRQIPESLSPEEYISASREAALRAVEVAKLVDGVRLPDGVFTDLWPELAAGFRPVQASCEALTRGWNPENAPGLILIEAPMGEGKTEAALYLAARLMHVWEKSGFYMALPTAATSNSMYDRLRDFLNGHGIGGLRLMHAQSWMVEDGLDGGEGEARTWLAPMKRAMLSQYAVGTIDQAMLGVLRVRSGVVRLLGLGGKVLILDEVHAYDAYMQGIIGRLLSWCAALAIPVVLLSATLPSSLRTELIKAYAGVEDDVRPGTYPSIACVRPGRLPVFTDVAGSAMRNRVRVETRPLIGENEEIAELALSLTEGGGCVGVVMNTVLDAQEVFRRVRGRVGEGTFCLLFHARFPMTERLQIERECIRRFGKGGDRPRRAILVATQTVEQSIDIDLDVLVTALCPADLLLQRIGRMWRHKATVRPESITGPCAVVLTPEGDALDMASLAVYSPFILRRTRWALSELEAIELPGDIQPLVERVYKVGLNESEAEWRAEWDQWVALDALKKSNARYEVYDKPKGNRFFAEGNGLEVAVEDDDQTLRGAKTRDGDGGLRGAILPAGAVRDLKRPSREEAEAALRVSFPMPVSWEKTVPESALHPEGALKGLILLPPDADGRVRMGGGKALWDEDGVGVVLSSE